MEKYEQVIRDGYQFNMDQYLKNGWSMFKRGAGSLIGYAVIVIIATIVINFIPFVGLLSGFLQAAFIAGFFIFCRQMLNNKENFNQLFEGFNSFGQIAVFVLLRFLFILPLLVLLFTVVFPFEIVSDLIRGDIDPEYIAEEIALGIEGNLGIVLISYLIMIMGFFYIYISYAFALPLIVDAKLEFWQAMEVSRKVIGKKFFMFLLMFLIIGIVAGIATAVTCGLGMFVVFPYIYCVVFAAYDDILKPQDDQLSS